jgi:hypothetical protein
VFNAEPGLLNISSTLLVTGSAGPDLPFRNAKMAKQKLRIRAARLEPELNKRVERATREGGFSNPSAFIRASIERELAAILFT